MPLHMLFASQMGRNGLHQAEYILTQFDSILSPRYLKHILSPI